MSRASDGFELADGRARDHALTSSSILIVDDNEVNVELVRRVLGRAGAERVHATTDAREAVSLADRVEADIVLLDLHMPFIDGFEVLRQLAESRAPGDFLPVVILTADTNPESRVEALRCGATDFLTKPLEQLEVVLRVRNLLHARSMHVRLRQHNEALAREVHEQQERQAEAERHRRELRERVEAALDPGARHVVFQPIVELASGRTVGLEALTRFDLAPRRTPDVWFGEAAEVGLAAELELAAVTSAVEHLPSLPDDVYLSVNVSPEVALRPEVSTIVAGSDPRRLVLEITEHARVADYGPLTEGLGRLRRDGARIAVDDAGAGYASLQHILKLAPDIIKLDLALTRGIDDDPVRRNLAKALVGIAADLRSTLVAEGIETAAEMAALVSLGVACGQGYFLGRPAPL